MRRLGSGGSCSYLGNGSNADLDDQRVARRVSGANQTSSTCGRGNAAAHLSAMADVIGEESAEVIVVGKPAGPTSSSPINRNQEQPTSEPKSSPSEKVIGHFYSKIFARPTGGTLKRCANQARTLGCGTDWLIG
jgi:hypothetical protein